MGDYLKNILKVIFLFLVLIITIQQLDGKFVCYLPVLVLCREYLLVPVLFLLFDGLLHIYVTYYIYNVKTVYYLKGGS